MLGLHDESPAGGKLTVFENSTLRLRGARGDLKRTELTGESLKLRSEPGRVADRKKITLRHRENKDRRRERKRGHDPDQVETGVSCPNRSKVGSGDEGGGS